MRKKLIETNGKTETFAPSTLDQIWGDNGLGKYNTMDLDKYIEYLNGLNKSDLQSHAYKIGLMPLEDRTRLVNSLVKAFKTHVGSYKSPKTVSTTPTNISKEAQSILAEGR